MAPMAIIISPVLTAGQLLCRVRVNLTHNPQQALDATGRKQRNINPSALDSMPRGEGDERDVIFFKPNRFMTGFELKSVYESLRLYPADPYSLCGANESDPIFADQHPNLTIWEKLDGKQCYVAFHNRYCNIHVVDVGVMESYDKSLDCHWWYAGISR